MSQRLQFRREVPRKEKRRVPFISWPIWPWRRAQIYEDLGGMLESGLSILEAVRTLADTYTGPARRLFEGVLEFVEKGRPLGEALVQYPQYVSEGEAALIAAAEEAGNLPEVLKELAAYYRFQVELIRSNWLMIVYPLLLYVLGAFLLNIPCAVKYGSSAYIRRVSLWLGVLAGAILLFIAGASLTWVRLLADRLKGLLWYIPIASLPIKHGGIGGYARGIAAGLKAGFGIRKVLEIGARLAGSPPVMAKNKRAVSVLERGGDFFEAVKATGLFNPGELASIRAAERAGTLEPTMNIIARDRMERYKNSVKILVFITLMPFFVGMLGFIGYQVFEGLKQGTMGQLQQIEHQIMRETPFRHR